MILRDFEPRLYEPPEDTLRKAYSSRVLLRFAGFFGLVDIEQVSEGPVNREYRVRAAGLLDEVVEWNLRTENGRPGPDLFRGHGKKNDF